MRRLLKYGVCLFLVIAVPLGAYVWYASWSGQRMVDEIVAELDAQGPWRWEDLVAARPATADNQLAPRLIEKVQAAMPAGWNAAKALEELPQNPVVLLDPEQAAALSDHLKRVNGLIEQGRTLVELPKGRMRLLPVKENDLFPDFDRVQHYREFASLMSYDAWHQAHVGDLDAAMTSILAIVRASETIEDELTLLPHLVRIALEAIALGALERALAQGQPPAEALKRMQEALARIDPEAAFRAALAGERAHVDRACRGIASGTLSMHQLGGRGPVAPGAQDRLAEAYFRISLNEARAAMLKALTETIKAFDLPGAQRVTRIEQIDTELHTAPPLARVFGPALAKYHEAFARSQAKRHCAIAALAAERFRREAGRWPKTLEELTPKFLEKTPLDPFTDGPLGYRPTRNGVVLYSVGPEGKFDGSFRDGKNDDPTASSYEFRLWNVPQRRQVARAAR
jgi:tetratricopeptide (TPR) repeat protein